MATPHEAFNGVDCVLRIRNRLALGGLRIFQVVDPNLKHVGGLAGQGMSLSILSHSRKDEDEADRLGLRYLAAAKYDPAATLAVLEVLAQIEAASAQDAVPSWASTHPATQARLQKVRAELGQGAAGKTAARLDARYWQAVSGMMVGDDPRRGYARASTYVLPQLGLAFEAPLGWAVESRPELLVAIAPEDAGIFLMRVFSNDDEDSDQRVFLTRNSVPLAEAEVAEVGGATITTRKLGEEEASTMSGLITDIRLEQNTVRFIAAGIKPQWPELEPQVAASLASLHAATAAQINVEALRLKIDVPKLPIDMQAARQRCEVALAQLRILNRLSPKADASPANLPFVCPTATRNLPQPAG